MSEAPEKQSARPPAKEAELADSATHGAEMQWETAWLSATKGWLRMSRTERVEFLRDVRAGCPSIWKQVGAEFEKGGRR